MHKILIAEDDAFLLDIFHNQFVENKFKVKLAENGEEALKTLETFVPDVMILDLLMPKLDGFEVLEKMKVDDKLSKIPVIVASNLDSPENIEKAMELGAVDYFVKSNISIQDLIEKCKKYL